MFFKAIIPRIASLPGNEIRLSNHVTNFKRHLSITSSPFLEAFDSRSVSFYLEEGFFFLGFSAPYFGLRGCLYGTVFMRASRSYNAFALKCSVQLVMEGCMGMDALTILKSQPGKNKTK